MYFISDNGSKYGIILQTFLIFNYAYMLTFILLIINIKCAARYYKCPIITLYTNTYESLFIINSKFILFQ